MSEPSRWVRAVRTSHDRFAALVSAMTADQVSAPSYASDWTIADVASHLGSQAEIFDLFLDAGLTESPAPGGEVFGPIWDRWNARSPAEQVATSVEANEAFVTRLEQVPAAASFSLSMFGADVDLAGLAALRLGEHALHTWDVAAALEPSATVSPDAVALLVDTVGTVAARSGQPLEGARAVTFATTAPQRRLRLTLHPVVAMAAADDEADLVLPAEALIRLVYGRLDEGHTPDGIVGAEHLDRLRAIFPGF